VELLAQVAGRAPRGSEEIDLLSAHSVAPPAAIPISPDDDHPNAWGHALVAGAICHKMQSLETTPELL
jgi:hypothetical protein